MGTIVDATVPTSQFALSETFERVPDAEFETIRIVAQGQGYVMPLLRASASDLDALHEALEADPTVENVERLVREEGTAIYRMEWQARIRLVAYVLGMERGTLLGTHGTDRRWLFRVLFPDHDSVSSTYEFCREYGIDLSIRRVEGVEKSIDPSGITLTDEQREALTAGFETDYYDVPRGRSLEELADELDVSHQALSERLRRGHRALIEGTLRR